MNYLTFIDIYRYIVWVLGREDTRAHLVLFTLIDREGEPLESSEQLEEVRQRLERAIIRSVRRSDLYTRYGKNQFLVLVTSTDQKGCHIAAIACARISGQQTGERRLMSIMPADRLWLLPETA